MGKKVCNIISVDAIKDKTFAKDYGVKSNLALQKIKKYYELQGYEIISDDAACETADVTYASVLFRKNRYLAKELESRGAIVGGTGWDLTTMLPPEIEEIKPKVNFGFTTRGCNRNCSFCFVPEKEGKIKIVGDLLDLWDGVSKTITLMDNNVLLLPGHFDNICEQAKALGVKLDWNQGLDFRIFDLWSIAAIKGTKSDKKLRFALDYKHLIPAFEEKLPLLKQAESTPFVYVYTDGSNPSNDLERLKVLLDNKCKPYLMRDEKLRKNDFGYKGDILYNSLSDWVNNEIIKAFTKMSFADFVHKNRKNPEKILSMIDSPLVYDWLTPTSSDDYFDLAA